jgi:hypothetical protein
MARKSDLYFVSNGVLKNYVPIRIHDRGRFDEDQKKWVPVDKIIVMMMSDIVYYDEWREGVKTGDVRKKFIKPMSFIPCAGAPNDPRMSATADRVYSGTIVRAEVDGEEMTVLVRREKGDESTDVHLLVREGWKPHRFRGPEFGKYLPSVVGDIKHGKRIGKPGSFVLGGGGAFAEASAEAADLASEDEALLRGHFQDNAIVGGLVCHYALYRLADKESVLGQTKNGEMWRVVNEGGELVFANRNEAEAMRPIYDLKEEQRVKEAKAKRIARLKKEKADRLRRQEAAATKPALEVIDDQVAPPDAVTSEEVSAEQEAVSSAK